MIHYVHKKIRWDDFEVMAVASRYVVLYGRNDIGEVDGFYFTGLDLLDNWTALPTSIHRRIAC
jgi:hypothetical protein